MNFFATTPKGLELLLVDELKQLGATTAHEKLAGVEFQGDIEIAYKACLWSRLANRILLPLTSFPANTPEKLYAGIQSINWQQHFTDEETFAVKFISTQSEISHTLYGAQKVKDAIVDQFRDKTGYRPNIDKAQPDIHVYVRLNKDKAQVFLDLSGISLHKRGYRLEQGEAPLKENLAAAILLRAKWPELAKRQGTLIDPMCGSGTLLIEAALMAGNIAPNLHRKHFGFLKWKKHQADIWHKVLKAAQADANPSLIPTIIGYDIDSEMIAIAFNNIERANLRGKIHVEKKPLELFSLPKNKNPGLIITNPPYGERLGEIEELKLLYHSLGELMKTQCLHWQGAVFTSNPDLGKEMRLRAKKYYPLMNGALVCKLLLFDIKQDYFYR